MSSVARMSDQELRMTMRELVGRERSALLDVVDHLAEVEARELHLQWGYASLWAYCEKELGLEEGVAHQRITLARIFRRKPEVRERVVSGKIGAYAATLLRDFLDAEDFAEILRSAEGMSKRALEDHLAVRRAKPVARKDTIRRVAPVTQASAVTQTVLHFDDAPMPQREAATAVEVRTHRIGFVATEEFVENLRRAQDVAGTSDLCAVLTKALDAYLDKHDPVRREARRQKRRTAAKAQASVADSGAQPTQRPRRALSDAVVVRDDARCTYRAPDGTRCNATRHIQRDHVRPWALGGPTTAENLRVLCRAHNLMLARQTFGLSFRLSRIKSSSGSPEGRSPFGQGGVQRGH